MSTFRYSRTYFRLCKLPAMVAVAAGGIGLMFSSMTTTVVLSVPLEVRKLALSFGEYRLTYNTSIPLDTMFCGLVGAILITIGFWWEYHVRGLESCYY